MNDIVLPVTSDVSQIDGLEFKDGTTKLAVTIDNFYRIMQVTPPYQRIHFNLMKWRPEIHDGDEIRAWTDTDESASRHYIEANFHIHNKDKHLDALRLLFRDREVNPLMDLIESFAWDGENRCELFLPAIMKASDTA